MDKNTLYVSDQCVQSSPATGSWSGARAVLAVVTRLTLTPDRDKFVNLIVFNC